MPALITALGAVTAHGRGVSALADALRAGRTGVRPVARFPTAGLCSELAAAAPIDTGGDRALELMQLALDEALAGRDTAPSRRRAAVLGSTKGSLQRVLAGERDDGIAPLAAALASRAGARGPVVAIGAACASTSAALGEALSILEAGEADEVVVAGVEALHAFVFAGFHALKAMSARPSQPFDQGRSGLSMGEGAGVLVLESEAAAQARGARALARLLGHGGAADVWDQTAPHPEGEGLLRACRAALARAQKRPEDVGRYHAHGTATVQNDQMEAATCRALFGAQQRPVMAIKGSIGHTMGAAAALDAIAAVRALQAKELWPVVGHQAADPAFGLDVVTQVRPHDGPVALVATAGFGGINGALVLERGDAP